MSDETTELTQVQAILNGLSSPTDEQFVQAVRAYSDGAVASAAAKLALAGGGNGGSLPAWWTVDSTPGSESLQLDGELRIGNGLAVLSRQGQLSIDGSEAVTNPIVAVFVDSGYADPALQLLNEGGNFFTIGPTGAVTISPSDDVIAQIVNAAAGQTERIQEWQLDGTPLAWLEADGTPGGTLAGASPFTKETTVVSVADIEDLHNTPVVVTSAPSAGSMLVPIQMIASQEGGETAWAAIVPPIVYVTTVDEWTNQSNQGTWGKLVRNPFLDTGISGSLGTNTLFEGYDDLTHAGADGQGLAIVSDNPVTDGNATLTVTTWYATVPTPT